MSNAPKERPKVPEGKTRFMTTRQKAPTATGYVGYDVIWEPMQKVAEYETPKTP